MIKVFSLKKNPAAKEKGMLIECAALGFSTIGKYFTADEVARYFAAPLVRIPDDNLSRLDGYLYSNNVDLYYVFLSVLYSTGNRDLIGEVIAHKDMKVDFTNALDHIEDALYRESPYERDLVQCVSKYVAQSDDEIKAAYTARFEVVPFSMMELPVDRSAYFAKVNHGLWEFIRGAYDEGRELRTQFREINIRYMLREARTSGLTQLWGRQVSRYIQLAGVQEQKSAVSFSVSLTAGIESPAHSIRKDLNPVTRGAAIGMLSTFEVALPGSDKLTLGDGGATRSLIIDRQLEAFFEKYIADTEACLFLVPPHLKMVDFVSYKGDVYKFLVPPTKVNNAWKVFVATFIGYLTKLSGKYRSISIVAQGASVVSAIGLLLAEMEDEFPDTKLRYFDLGRILDVTTPEVLQKQAWAAKERDEYILEGTKVFRSKEQADCVLATLI